MICQKLSKNFNKINPYLILFAINLIKNIGGWRNETSLLVSSDVIVCMDRDDYYPLEKISHAVERLSDKKTLLAGCNKTYFFDIHYNKFYQFNGFGPTHSTNNCMAYWREYLNNHSYDVTVTHAK
ncbi:Glycosyltransferase_GTA_type super family protein [Acanthamoeba polyphaga moumouvirus]|uniref:Glycosyltransferase_GTA_type super family protein n=1 Tax=Acanthamoeba polyphaga moumouvirus TaxID=1269028 RepID=L7RCN0_9VIRU|nr:Glycosyltransferase_GTA_type super family protein [Acanthamoeba polyphaga moumouvirus]AGC01763.1 Glycosyltransferase_GTA_type super family protein [Acanthamoeba polyphaga moumouvirus]